MVSWSMCNLSVFRGASPSVRQPSASGAPPRRNNQKFLSDSNQKSQIPLSNTTSQYHSPVIRKSPNTGFIPGNLKHWLHSIRAGSVRLERRVWRRSWTAHADRHQKSADAVLWRRRRRTGQRRRFFEVGFRSSPSCASNSHS